MQCTPILVCGQDLDRKFFIVALHQSDNGGYSYSKILAIISRILLLKFCFDFEQFVQEHQRDSYSSLTIDCEEYFKLTFDFQFDLGRRSEYTAYMIATPLHKL